MKYNDVLWDPDSYAGPTNNIAWHIHLLYMLILHDGLTAEDIKRADPIVVATLINHRASQIAGEWEGGRYASGAKRRALKLINDFIIL